MHQNHERNSLKHTTRGGQVFLHNLRMICQVMGKVLLWLSPIILVVALIWFFCATDMQSRYIGKEWLRAHVHVFFNGKQYVQQFNFSDGRSMQIYAGQLLAAPFIKDTVVHLLNVIQTALLAGVIAWVISVSIVLGWLKRSGAKYIQKTPMKGDVFQEAKEVSKLVEKDNGGNADLQFGKESLVMPSFSELQHYLMHGTVGSGKSTLIKALLDLIRARGERAIVYDKSCTLISQFFRPGHDNLLNALDTRSVDWHLWTECRDKTDFENLAAALIPMTPTAQDPFWVNAARTIFSAAAFRMSQEENPSVLTLLKNLLTADIDELQTLLSGTEAESLMSEKAEKTAISIKSVLATYLKSLCYIKDGDNPFSIRQWVQNDESKEWLFISSLGDRHESLKPLMTSWLDIAVNALLSLPESRHRRIWVILDELASLQQLPYLTSGLSEARKFGGCFVIGIQSYAQLSKLYGIEGAREISSLLNTRFLFRVPDPDIAKWSAQNLGETLVEEVREGISYGANSMRDGVSIQRTEREKPVISPSEIMRLPNLSCYVRLSGAYPITQINLQYIDRPTTQTPFIPRVLNQDVLRTEVETLMDGKATTASVGAEKALLKHEVKKKELPPHAKNLSKKNKHKDVEKVHLFLD